MAEAEDRGEKRGIRIGEDRGRAAEREKAEAKMAAERAAMMNALRAAGVSEDIIEKACSDAERGRFGNAMIDMFDGVLR